MSELDVAVPKSELVQKSLHTVLRGLAFREKIEGIKKNVPDVSETTIAYLLIDQIFRDAGLSVETSKGQKLLNTLMSPALLKEIRERFLTTTGIKVVSEVRAAIDKKVPWALNEIPSMSESSSELLDRAAYEKLNPHQRSCVDYVLGLQSTLRDLRFWDESIKPIVPPATRAKNVPSISLSALDQQLKKFFTDAQAVYSNREKAAIDVIKDPEIQSQLEVLFAFAKSGREIMGKHRDDTGKAMGAEKMERVKGSFTEIWSWLMSKKRGVPLPARSSDLSNPLYIK